MARYLFVVTVDTDTLDNAKKVIKERLDHNEDYGFDYSLVLQGTVENTEDMCSTCETKFLHICACCLGGGRCLNACDGPHSHRGDNS